MKTKKYKKQERKTRCMKIKKGGKNTPSKPSIKINPIYLTPTSKRRTLTKTNPRGTASRGTRSRTRSNSGCTVMNMARPKDWKWEGKNEFFRLNVEKYKGQVNDRNIPHGYGYLASDDKIKLYQGFWDNGVARNCPSLSWKPMTKKNINKRINEVLQGIAVKKGPAMRQGARKTLPSLN